MKNLKKRHKMWKIPLLILAVVVLIALYELIGIFIAYKKQPDISAVTKKETVRELQQIHNAKKSKERAVVIEDNEKALVERIRLIENAKEEIILSTFAFHSDESGKRMMGALLNAADRGVHIRILADGFESWTAMEGNPYFYTMSCRDNIEIKIYNRANPFKPWKLMGRMHDKYLIADGETYILGGRNTYNFFLGNFQKYRNYDRDVLVYCKDPGEDNSIHQLKEYFEGVWKRKECKYFHRNKKLADRDSVKNAAKEIRRDYESYLVKNKKKIADTDYKDETFAVDGIQLISNPTHTGAKEPVVWYKLGELMKQANSRVKIHTPYIICNEMMYDTWTDIANKVFDFSVMTNSVTNNGNPFGAADYAKNQNRIQDTRIKVWEYEGGYSYHGKSILIDDDLSVVGSFNMDMRSTYLDTELMLVIKSKKINAQLEEGMMEYEKMSRLNLRSGIYFNPYQIEPVKPKEKRQRQVFFVKHFLGWTRFLF